MGCFLAVETLCLDLLGGALSYLFGSQLEPKLTSLCFQLIDAAVGHLVPSAHLPGALLTMGGSDGRLGLLWVAWYLLAHLWYPCRAFLRRSKTRQTLCSPSPGDVGPGEQKWELVQFCYSLYRQGLGRFLCPFALQVPPDFRYGRQVGRPLGWLGRTLVIDEPLLVPERLQWLLPRLARALASYNCADLWLHLLLDCYPETVSPLRLLTGIYLEVPLLLKRTVWRRYWRGRVLAADRFAYYLGQGEALLHQLYQTASSRTEPPGSFFSPFPSLSERTGQLEALLRDEYAWLTHRGAKSGLRENTGGRHGSV